ncbi:MAG: transporter substrate-binding domain-containing protein [Rhizobiales bacterium]|nr:transporter substrate-binding domain-containing protein [Hyphomicrobiales bacterium]
MRRSTLAIVAFSTFVMGTLTASAQNPDEPYPVPGFRFVDTKAQRPEPLRGAVRILVDDGFPPFHYRDESNRLLGLNVDLANAVCSELRARCEIKVMPFADLFPALQRNEGDVIISALRLTPQVLTEGRPTRPFYRSLGHFAGKVDNPVTSADPVQFAGKKIGVVGGSAHEAWLKRYYAESQIVAFPEPAALGEALKSGVVDVIFDDAVRLVYWVKGETSDKCCKLIDGAFVDAAYFSQPLSFIVRRARDDNLLESFDWALDRLQANGTFATLFQRYVPLDPWAASASASQPTASSTAP